MVGSGFSGSKCCVEGLTPAPDCNDSCVANAAVGATFVGSTNDIYVRIDKSTPCVLADWELIGGAGGSFTNFIISDGVNTQTIDDGNTLLFATGQGLTATVSATDTVTHNIILDTLTGAGNTTLSLSANGLYSAPFIIGVIDTLTDVDTTTTAPNPGEFLSWDGTNWVPATSSGASGRRPFVVIGSATATSATDVLETDSIWHSGRVLIGASTKNIPGAILEVTGNVGFGGTSQVDILGTNSSILAGNSNSIIAGANQAIASGNGNILSTNSDNSFIGGGTTNTIGAGASLSRINNFIGAGNNNSNDGTNSVIVGGSLNVLGVQGQNSFSGAGTSNTNNGRLSFLGSGDSNSITTLIGAIIVGGDTNTIDASAASYASIVGGQDNIITGLQSSLGSFIGNGRRNSLNSAGPGSAIVTGDDNTITGNTSEGYCFIGAGRLCTVQEEYSAIVTGENNLIDSTHSFIGSGENNDLSPIIGTYNAILCGLNNTIGVNAFAFTDGATILGGTGNSTDGDNSVVGGTLGTIGINGNGTFLFNSDTALTVNTANQFVAKGSGGVIFYTNSAATTGLQMLAGTSAWVAVSTKAVKNSLVQTDNSLIADKFKTLPTYVGKYNDQADDNTHMLFVAEEWNEAFKDIVSPKTVQSSETKYPKKAYKKRKVTTTDENGKETTKTESYLDKTGKQQAVVTETELAGISYMDIMVAQAAALSHALNKIDELEARIVVLENK